MTDGSSWLAAWDHADRQWRRFEVLVLVALVLGLLLVALGRWMLAAVGAPVPAIGDELLRAGALWLIMLSAAQACAQCCDESRAKPLNRSHLRWVLGLSFAAALACLLLMSAALRYLLFDLHLGSRPLLGTSMGWWLLPLPLLFLVMGLRLLRRSLDTAEAQP